MLPKISFCITIKNRAIIEYKNKDNKIIKLMLLKKNLEQLLFIKKDIDNFELCIVDYNSTDVDNLKQYIINIIGTSIPLKFIILNKYFSRGEGLNYAFTLSTGKPSDIVFFLDTDMVVGRQIIDNIYKYCFKYNYVYFPICGKFIDYTHKQYKPAIYAYGNVAMKKKIFLQKKGGWMHNRKWGKEDEDMYFYYRKIAIRDYTHAFFHQWHPEDIKFKNKYYNSI